MIGAIAAFARPTLFVFHEVARALGSIVTMAGAAMTLGSGPWFQPADNAAANAAAWTVLIFALVVLGMQAAFSIAVLARKPATPSPGSLKPGY
jgi:hypothetical protein